MQKITLGEFEELVLLTVAVMKGEAYGAVIATDIAARTNRPVHISAVHMALYRLEEKRLLESKLGGATSERGGRRKRLFTITPLGIKILEDIRGIREQLWSLILKPV